MQEHGKLRREQRLRIGLTVATFPEGMDVTLGAIDKDYHKRIVDFGDRLIDWMPQGWVDEVVEIIPCQPPRRETEADQAK